MKFLLLVPAILLLFMTGCKSDKSFSGNRVDSLISIMTLEEKIGQMVMFSGMGDLTGPSPFNEKSSVRYDQFKQGLVGSMLNVHGVDNIRKVQETIVNGSRLGIPAVFGFDVIHGHKTLAPIPLAEAASWDLAAIENSARVAALEASAMGLNWTFAPMVDIYRDARWGRVMEGAGEDPYLGSRIAEARVRGFQGDDLSSPGTLAACAKHFAGYGFIESGKEYNTVDVGTSTLYNVILPPFKAALDADVKTFMNSFSVLNGVPATGSNYLQRDILKGKWGFEGFVVSDWASIAEMEFHGYARDHEHTAELAANAGSDVDMESYAYVMHLKNLVESGKVQEETIDESVRRILTVKEELGLLDDPYRYLDNEREKTLVGNPDFRQSVLDMARKSIVLLKNENNLLPLSKDQSGIALIGALANDNNSPLGSWRIGSDNNTAVTVLEGFEKKNSSVTYARGADVVVGETHFVFDIQVNEDDRSGFREAVQLARNSKVVVMVLGEHGFMSGEGRSRTELGLPGVQQELLEAVYAVNKNIVLIVMSGRPLILNWADDHIPAIVQGWQLGTETGNALADVIFGDYNPGGKLPMSFPRAVGQLPLYYNYFHTGRAAALNPREVFWSHYTDESNDPLYPFGYGLSYTTFSYDQLDVQKQEGGVKVSVMVENTGSRAGEEVVQLYIRDRSASIVRPVKELKGFEKIMLQPGESRQVSFDLGEKELGFYNNYYEFVVEPGEFDLMVGTSSAEGITGSFELEVSGQD